MVNRLTCGTILLLILVSGVLAEDYYRILGVSRSASNAQLKRAYRKLAVEHHPDKNPDDPKATDKFAKINNAYEVLSDPEKRRTYDRYGEDGVKQMGSRENTNTGGFDVFNSFFGGFGFDFGGGGNREPETPKGPNVNVDLECTLYDLYNGRVFTIDRIKSVAEKAPGKRRCNCRQVAKTQQVGPGMFSQSISTECDQCDNVRFVPEKFTLDVEVESGMHEGKSISFFEEGEPILDGDPGDLVFTIREVHDKYRPGWSRVPNTELDLMLEHWITLEEALIGFRHIVKNLDGSDITLSNPGVVQYGDIETMKGLGMPSYANNRMKGDLHIQYLVKLPEPLTKAQKKQIKDLNL